MSQLTTRSDRQLTVIEWLQSPKFQSSLQLAAPRGVQAGRFARIAETMIKGDRKLEQCELRSVLNAVMICAQTGLEPGPLGHAAIVPYGGKAQFQVMYRGLIHMMHRSEQIASIQAGVVREKDHFDWDEGSEPFVTFKRAMLPEAERGEKVAVYACIIPRVGKPYVRVMHISEIEAHRDQYAKSKGGPWVTAFDQMAMKTVIKQVGKLAPISIEAQIAISYDDLDEVGKAQPELLPPDLDTDRTPDSYCNKPLGDDGIVCSLDVGHSGECE